MWLRGSPELRLASRGRLSCHPLHKNETSFRKPTIGRNRCFLNHKKQSQAPCVLRSVLTTFVLTSKSSQNPPKTPRYCRLALLRKCILPSKKPSQSDLNWAYLKMGRPTGLEPATPGFTILCSNQLSYDRRKMRSANGREARLECQSLLPSSTLVHYRCAPSHRCPCRGSTAVIVLVVITTRPAGISRRLTHACRSKTFYRTRHKDQTNLPGGIFHA